VDKVASSAKRARVSQALQLGKMSSVEFCGATPPPSYVFGHATACPATPFIANCAGQNASWNVLAYCGMTSFFGGTPALGQGVGYGVVIGFGVFFSLFTTLLVWLDAKFVGTVYTSEQFNTAGRTVKTGLTASNIVSMWTWAATLLQSSNVAYAYGVSGPFWYASGATIQIFLFGIIAIEIKRKAPNAHTMPEIVLARWGHTAHKVFIFFALLTNIIVTAMLLLGGASVLTALTGMSLYAGAFLIPVGVILYTVAGGLKAAFLSAYLHTSAIMIILCCFVYVVYTGNGGELGSADEVYERLTTKGNLFPVANNENGSYLTMLSSGGLMFGIINVVGNFGTVFLDQSYWMAAIAARPSAATKGYLLGGFVWFSIPFALATSLGLAAIALDLPVTSEEAGAGLVPPAAAVHFWGEGGALAILILLFMAVTATGSSELIAVSSICTYDIYRVYVNPAATGKDILRVTRGFVVAFGLFMGVLAIVLFAIGLNLGWVYLWMGVVIGSGVIPVFYLLVWRKCSANAAMTGAVIGFVSAITAWLASAQSYYGEITILTTGQNEPMLIGNLVAILGSGLICTVMSLLNPDDFDFEATKNIPLIDDVQPDLSDCSPEELAKARKWIIGLGSFFTVLVVIIWPVLTIPAGIFSKGYFSFWVYLSVTWATVASVVIIALPLWESKDDIIGVCVGLFTCTPAPKPEAKTPEVRPESVHGAQVSRV
jgi:SSS family transporter